MQIQLKSLDQRILAILKFRVCLLLLPFASLIARKRIFRHVTSPALCTARNTQAATLALLPSPKPGAPKTSAIAWGAFSFVNPSFSWVWIVQQRKPVKALQYPLQKAGFHVGWSPVPAAWVSGQEEGSSSGAAGIAARTRQRTGAE